MNLDNKFIKSNKLEISDNYNFLISFQCNYNVEYYEPKLFDFYKINFPESIKMSVFKRQAEYLAGRIMASRAIYYLEQLELQVPIGKNRSPVWPTNISGSISHTSNTAICIAGLKTYTPGIGIDIEEWLSIQTINEIQNLILNDNEVQLLKSYSVEFRHLFTIIFSAKESLFKALFPMIGFYFDFKDVELISISPSNCSFELRLLNELSHKYQSGFRFRGIFIQYNNTVKTLIVL